jgi:hypothetical protein
VLSDNRFLSLRRKREFTRDDFVRKKAMKRYDNFHIVNDLKPSKLSWEEVQQKIIEQIAKQDCYVFNKDDPYNSKFDKLVYTGYGRKQCVICGRKFFYADIADGLSDRVKYCGRKCASKAYAKSRLEKRKEIRNNLVCAYCGKVFTAKRADKRFCSHWHKIKGLEAEKYAAKNGIKLRDLRAEAAEKKKKEQEEAETMRLLRRIGM